MMRPSSSATFSTTLLTWTGKREGHLSRAMMGNLLRKSKISAARTRSSVLFLLFGSLLLLALLSFFTSSPGDEIRSRVSTISSSGSDDDDDESTRETLCLLNKLSHMKKMNPGGFLCVELTEMIYIRYILYISLWLN
jgi:hypothetical protein